MGDDLGYIDYRDILDLQDHYKPADVIRTYRKKMKHLRIEMTQEIMTEEQWTRYLLLMAQLNAAFYILRDRQMGEAYLAERNRLMQMEQTWRDAADEPDACDTLRRQYDQALRSFLTRYMEELVLEAGRDPECLENSGWTPVHERHAARALRQYRQQEYHQILERLPYYETTPPIVDWKERAAFVNHLAVGGAGE